MNKNSTNEINTDKGEGVNVYIEFLLFTIILTTILSLFYIPIFKVKNHGQLSYSSTQTLLGLRLDLLKKESPDMIIVMNGFDDYKNFWKCISIDCTDFYTHDFLKKYWIMRNQLDFFDEEVVLFRLKHELFYNTSLQFKKAKKWFLLNKAQKNISKWKYNYKEKVENYSSDITNMYNKYITFYLSNMRDIMYLANENNIKLVFVHTPIIFNSKKVFVAHEPVDNFHIATYFFAMPFDKLDTLTTIPSHQILRKWFWNKQDFIEGYNDQKNKLKDMSSKEDVYFHDINPDIEENSLIPIFENIANPTDKGTKVYAESLSKLLFKIYSEEDR